MEKPPECSGGFRFEADFSPVAEKSRPEKGGGKESLAADYLAATSSVAFGGMMVSLMTWMK
jgi:hypothetical protein